MKYVKQFVYILLNFDVIISSVLADCHDTSMDSEGWLTGIEVYNHCIYSWKMMTMDEYQYDMKTQQNMTNMHIIWWFEKNWIMWHDKVIETTNLQIAWLKEHFLEQNNMSHIIRFYMAEYTM